MKLVNTERLTVQSNHAKTCAVPGHGYRLSESPPPHSDQVIDQTFAKQCLKRLDI
jgi:hypothetical protein